MAPSDRACSATSSSTLGGGRGRVIVISFRAFGPFTGTGFATSSHGRRRNGSFWIAERTSSRKVSVLLLKSRHRSHVLSIALGKDPSKTEVFLEFVDTVGELKKLVTPFAGPAAANSLQNELQRIDDDLHAVKLVMDEEPASVLAEYGKWCPTVTHARAPC